MNSTFGLWPSLIMTAVAAVMAGGCSDSINSNSAYSDFSAPPSDCLWVGPYVKDNEGFNFAYPDSSAIYWGAVYRLPEEGAYITLEADFPFSRYISYNSYNADTSPAKALTDRDIVPELGSINPFVDGNARNDSARRYVVSVLPGEPQKGKANTLYDAAESVGGEASLLCRNYVPNDGSDLTGDVGLPRVTLHLADGSTLQGDQACEALSVGTEPPGIPVVPADIYQSQRDDYEPAVAGG